MVAALHISNRAWTVIHHLELQVVAEAGVHLIQDEVPAELVLSAAIANLFLALDSLSLHAFSLLSSSFAI